MVVKFWGVRGSFTTARADVLRYGGNTSCVSVTLGKRLLVFDAGSGIRLLGEAIEPSIREVFIVLTHLHRDHLEGFPFFAPLYEEGRRIHLIDYQYGRRRWSLLSMLDGINYPMLPESVTAETEIVRHREIDYLLDHGFDISRLRVNHPGGAYGYRVTKENASFVHIPDNELLPPRPLIGFHEAVSFCKNADVLSHDAMYDESDMPGKEGWGHSTIARVCELAIAAHVGHLVLFHHDPYRDDDAVDAIQERARAALKPHGISCTAAYEGLAFDL